MKKFTFLRSRAALLLLTVTLVTNLQTFAQQEAMFSQYMFNTLAINPAYAGSRDVLSLTALGRYQWLGVDGAPQTYTFSMDMPFKNEKMGIGITAIRDTRGLESTTGGYLTYAYRVKMGARTTLAFGVQGGLDNYRWNLQDAKNINVLDPSFQFGINKIFPNVGGGVYLSNDRGYIGVSVPRIIQHPLTAVQSDTSRSARMQRHIFTTMGFVLGKGAFKVKPSTMIRYTPGFGIGVDGNINFWIKDKIAFGVSARSNQLNNFGGGSTLDAIVGLLEVQLTPQLRLGYAYDYTMNKLKDAGTSQLGLQTHEAMLRYEFGFGKNKILTPRYF